MGRILIENVHDVKLLGRGIIDYSIKGGIRIANSRNVYVEGIVATQCATGGSENVTIRNVKSISYYGRLKLLRIRGYVEEAKIKEPYTVELFQNG